MIHRVMVMRLVQTLEPTVLAGHHRLIRRDILMDISLQRPRRLVVHVFSAKLAFTLKNTEYNEHDPAWVRGLARLPKREFAAQVLAMAARWDEPPLMGGLALLTMIGGAAHNGDAYSIEYLRRLGQW